MPSTTKKLPSGATPPKQTAAKTIDKVADKVADKVTDKRLASDTRVLRQFRVVINSVKTHFRQVEKVAGIGGAQLWALSVIHSNPGLGTNELSLAMDVHQSTASNLVKALVEQGLIEAGKTGIDRRAVMLHITPAGVKLLNKAPAPFSGVLPDALASLDDVTLTRLEEDLGKLIIALNADERAANTLIADL